jgi:hypothetical protein
MDQQTDTYSVNVTREDGWWMIHVPALDALTQAHSWPEVEPMARGVIAASLDVDMADVAVVINPVLDDETEHLLSEARTKAEAADRLQDEATAAKRQAARRLHSKGWSYRLIGKAMHLTHQRVEQLIKGTR